MFSASAKQTDGDNVWLLAVVADYVPTTTINTPDPLKRIAMEFEEWKKAAAII